MWVGWFGGNRGRVVVMCVGQPADAAFLARSHARWSERER